MLFFIEFGGSKLIWRHCNQHQAHLTRSLCEEATHKGHASYAGISAAWQNTSLSR